MNMFNIHVLSGNYEYVFLFFFMQSILGSLSYDIHLLNVCIVETIRTQYDSAIHYEMVKKNIIH